MPRGSYVRRVALANVNPDGPRNHLELAKEWVYDRPDKTDGRKVVSAVYSGPEASYSGRQASQTLEGSFSAASKPNLNINA